MAKTGVARIDNLMAGAPGVLPVQPGDSDREAVGAIQDLLIGLGHHELPDARLPLHGTYGPMTVTAVRQFRSGAGLPDSDTVDAACLTSLVRAQPTDPMASRVYLALALDLPVTSTSYLVTLTALWEANARFARLNRNTDRAGLSFGLIQWAQSPGRLHQILTAFHDADPARFAAHFGDAAAGLLAHTAKPNGGVDAAGNSTDPNFNLVADPWTGRFTAAGLDPVFQKVQVSSAAADAQSAYERLKDHADLIRSQRGVGFLLDVANQHGPAGALNIYTAVSAPGLTEPALLQRMRDESVRRVGAQFGAGSNEAQSTASRRDWFRTTTVLSDGGFALG